MSTCVVHYGFRAWRQEKKWSKITLLPWPYAQHFFPVAVFAYEKSIALFFTECAASCRAAKMPFLQQIIPLYAHLIEGEESRVSQKSLFHFIYLL